MKMDATPNRALPLMRGEPRPVVFPPLPPGGLRPERGMSVEEAVREAERHAGWVRRWLGR
jgi:hypothetical protein